MLNDHALIGFWPLLEPSGTPFFKNYSHNFGVYPSGLNFDMQVHVTDNDENESRSSWPGRATIFEPTSGTFYTGYYAGGDNTLNTSDGPFEKVLILGTGGFASRRALATPQVAQSGFTVGAWVLPLSDGFTPAVASMTKAILGQGHALLSKGTSTAGFFIGCSGRLSHDERNGDRNNRQLAGYAYLQGSTVGNSILLDVPIASGAFNHLTATYRHINGTSNEWVLYKNGRVVGSGVTNQELSNTTTGFNDSPFCIGGSLVTSDRIDNATGWGHLVSGVYAFERPLDEGEIQTLHDTGGLQTDNFTYRRATNIDLSDNSLIGYYPFISPGYVDVSIHHNPLIGNVDEGDEDFFIATTGPFDRGGTQINGSAIAIGLCSNSGLSQNLNNAANGAGFTLTAIVAPKGISSYLNNMMASFGSIGTAETPTLTNDTAGFFLTCRATTNGVRFLSKFFNDGDPNDSVTLLGVDSDIWTSTFSSVALIYDNATNGVAMYLNGELQSSGTLTVPFGQTSSKLIGLGYPLVFLNGASNAVPTTFATNGGIDTNITNIALFNKPLRADEIRGIAYSGIQLDPIYYSNNDPRLRVHWKCTGDSKFLIPDNALVFEKYAANLSRGLSDLNWFIVQSSDQSSSSYKIDYFSGIERSPESIGLGDLGISSGVYALMGGSHGVGRFSAIDFKSSYANYSSRVKPCFEERDLGYPHFYSEWILSFNITPSGTIPPVDINSNNEFNSIIYSYSEGGTASNSDRLIAYLTSINQPLGSGISISFLGVDGGFSTSTPLCSGNLIYGSPNRVLLHMKSENPYYFGDTPSSHDIGLSLFINGNLSYQRKLSSSSARMWSDGTPSSAADDWNTEIGGYFTDDTFSSQVDNKDSGLGRNLIKDIFIMQGKFSKDDIEYLAASGIKSNTNYGSYTDAQSTTSVFRSDSNLQFFSRFSSGFNGSGTKDLSLSANDADLLARRVSYNSPDNPLNNLRFVPGPIFPNYLNAQLSGITYNGNSAAATQVLPPYAISGIAFNDPENSFSFGFWYCQREDVTSNARIIASFGSTPSTTTTTTDIDAIWSVVIDDADNIKMIVSKDGRMYLSNAANAAKAGSFEIGAYRLKLSTFIDSSDIDLSKKGLIEPGTLDSWNHLCWVYDSSTKLFKCFLNGVIVDEKQFLDSFNTPIAESRILSLMIPSTSPWVWNNTLSDINGILSDVFYFDRSLTDSEVRYISYNGISDVTTNSASGIVGGYVHGLLQGSGIVGGYIRAIDSASGVIGGYLTSANVASGVVGGYIPGLADYSGIIGAFATGAFAISGTIGAFLQGNLQGSGIVGGFVNGGLSGIYAFDSSFHLFALSGISVDAITNIINHNNNEFDAVVQIFKSECIPICDIIAPSNVTGSSPTTYHFIGAASGCNNKTIVSAKWTFGDFSAPVYPSLSGSSFYPVFKTFDRPGKYIARFSIIDSDGVHNSAYRIVDLTDGNSQIVMALSGTPRSGSAALDVDFTNSVISVPANVEITDHLVDYDDGQTSRRINTSHSYTEHGKYTPVWSIRDSRGYYWSDSLNAGVNN